MKFYLISDNLDTLVGMRLVGIDGRVVHDRQSVLEELERSIQDKDVCIVLITTKLVELCPDVISELKLKQPRPLIVEIPDRHSSQDLAKAIDRYVSEAIGVKL